MNIKHATLNFLTTTHKHTTLYHFFEIINRNYSSTVSHDRILHAIHIFTLAGFNEVSFRRKIMHHTHIEAISIERSSNLELLSQGFLAAMHI